MFFPNIGQVKYPTNFTAFSRGTGICDTTFKDSLEENLEIIKSYPRGIADKYLWKIGGNMTSSVIKSQFPVIVTAFNSVYYPVAMGMFLSIHKLMAVYENKLKLVVYDLGLTRRQLRIVS